MLVLLKRKFLPPAIKRRRSERIFKHETSGKDIALSFFQTFLASLNGLAIGLALRMGVGLGLAFFMDWQIGPIVPVRSCDYHEVLLIYNLVLGARLTPMDFV